MNAEEIVKQKWPDARVARLEHGSPRATYVVIVNGNDWATGLRHSAEEAWQDAANRISQASGKGDGDGI